jgi:uncharacterized RDD family membrane protein YckC
MLEKYDTFFPRLGAIVIDGLPFIGLYFFLETVTTEIVCDIVSDIAWIFYSIYLHGKYGQTLGKWLFKIKVLDHATEKIIGFRKACFREIITIVFIPLDLLIRWWFDSYENSEFVFLGIYLGWIIAELIVMFSNSKRRSVHDHIAGSVVVKLLRF